MRKYADRNSKVELDKGTMPLSDCAMQSILSENKLIISRVPLMCVCAPNRTMMILYCTSQCQCPTISPTLASLICLKEGRQKMQKTQNQWNTDSTEAARAKQCSVLNHQQVVSVLDCASSVGTHPGTIATSDG